MSRRALVLLALAVAPLAARAQTITVNTAGDMSSLVGMPFDVPIVADWTGRPDRLGSFSLTLRWDPAVLRFDGGTSGSFGSIQANTDSAAQGVLKIAGANPAGVVGTMTLGIGRFTPLTAATTAVALDVSELFSAAPDFTNQASGATINGGLFCPARGFWGDPDGDHTVGSRDALIALSEAVGLDVSTFPEHGLSDVDADGAVKARDALVILSAAVGIDVSAFRVQRIAIGSCGSEQTTVYAVTPGGDTLVGGHDQAVHFELRATAAGVVRVLPDVFWTTSNPNVVAVLPDGRGVPLGPGTATITGKSGTRDSAMATVVVVNRRSHHYVDALAVSATNQLGTATYPYATIAQASAVSAEGDTVYVRPGRYDQGAAFSVGVLVQGLPGGSGVVVTSNSFANAALSFGGGARAEVRNITVDRVSIGVAAIGVDTLVVDSLHYFEGSGLCGDFGVGASDVWRLEVRRSEMRGSGPLQSCAGAVEIQGAARLLVVEDVQASDLADDAIFANSVDSVVVRRSTIHNNSRYAVNVGANRPGFGVVPVPSSVALLLEDNHFSANSAGGVSANLLRGGLATRTVIDATETDGFDLTGTPGADGFALVADTVTGLENYWVSTFQLDTLRIDSTRVTGTQSGFVDGFTRLTVTRSQFLGAIGNNEILDAIGNDTSFGGARVDMDSVTMQGAASCDECIDGLRTARAIANVSHFAGDNLYTALGLSDSSGTVVHSTFTHAAYGVYATGPSFGGVTSAPTIVTRGLTMTDVQQGVTASYEALVADSLALTQGAYGVQTTSGFGGPSGTDTVRNSTFTDYAYPLTLNDTVSVAQNNQLVRPSSYGIQVNGFGTPADSAIVVGNTVTCAPSGLTSVRALYGSNTNYRISGNTIQGCYIGMQLQGGAPDNTATIRGNTFLAPGFEGGAVQVTSPIRADVVGNSTFSSGTGSAISINGYSFQRTSFARVDSNTIHGARERAILVDYTDSVEVRGNLIDTVTSTSYFTGGAQGIAVTDNSEGQVTISGNTVRHVHGSGIYVYQLGVPVVAIDSNGVSGSDSAAVRVDAGLVSMRGNNIRSNAQNGVSILSCCGPHEIHGNAFQGNALYAVANIADATVNADSNWWGVDGGIPPGGPGADSTLTVFDNAPLANEPLPLPPLAPPVLRSTTLVASAFPSLTSTVVTVGPGAQVTPKPGPAPRALPHDPVARPAAKPPRQPTRASLPAALAGLRRDEQARAALAADRATREARRLEAIRESNRRRTQ